MAVIDGTNLLLGRMASVVAKRALKGEKIDIVNAEKVVVSGNKGYLNRWYLKKQKQGSVFQGPFFPKQADRIVRRTIRGMVAHKTAHGRAAYERIMCHIGVPDQFKNEKMETVERANVSKLPYGRYQTIKDIAKHIGGK